MSRRKGQMEGWFRVARHCIETPACTAPDHVDDGSYLRHAIVRVTPSALVLMSVRIQSSRIEA